MSRNELQIYNDLFEQTRGTETSSANSVCLFTRVVVCSSFPEGTSSKHSRSSSSRVDTRALDSALRILLPFSVPVDWSLWSTPPPAPSPPADHGAGSEGVSKVSGRWSCDTMEVWKGFKVNTPLSTSAAPYRDIVRHGWDSEQTDYGFCSHGHAARNEFDCIIFSPLWWNLQGLHPGRARILRDFLRTFTLKRNGVCSFA